MTLIVVSWRGRCAVFLVESSLCWRAMLRLHFPTRQRGEAVIRWLVQWGGGVDRRTGLGWRGGAGERGSEGGRGGRWQAPRGPWLHSAQLHLQTDARGETGRSAETTTDGAADGKKRKEKERRKERRKTANGKDLHGNQQSGAAIFFLLLDVTVKITTSGKLNQNQYFNYYQSIFFILLLQ